MDKHNRKKKTVDDTVCEIHKFSGYAVLSNCFVRSTNLSWSAIGLLARVMDFPHEWNFSKAGLIAICPDGETAIDTALSELKEWGYLEIKTLMPNESSTGRIQPLYSFYEYSATMFATVAGVMAMTCTTQAFAAGTGEVDTSSFITTACTVLKSVICLIGAGVGVWGVVNLLEGYGNDNPGAKAQ